MRGLCAAAGVVVVVLVPAAAACQLAPGTSRPTLDHGTAVIVWWSREPSPVAPFAASEMQRYLARMSGAMVPVLPGVVERSPSRAITATLVLLTGRAAREVPRHGASVSLDDRWPAELSGSLGDPADDSFAADVIDGDKLVLGSAGPRGLLYATYDFLTRLGVRFFAPEFGTYQGHAEYVPKRPITIPPYRTAQYAGLRSRVKDLDEGLSVSAATLGPLVDWMGKTRMNALAIPHDLDLGHISSYDTWRSQLLPLVAERGIVVEVGQHGYENWLPRSRYPQYYQPDYTVFDIADDEAVSAYIGAVVDYLSRRPEIGIFDAWPPDGASWPPAVFKRFGSASNAQAYLVAKLTDAVAERLPAVRVETIAYQATQEPPTAPYRFDPRRNVVDVAMSGRTYAAPMSAPVNAQAATLLERWRQVFSGELGAYEYYRMYAFRSLPVPLPDVIGGDLAWYRQAGAARIRTYGEPADWMTYELTHLEVAAIAWDPSIDARRMVSGYLVERYGAAAAAMSQYVHDAESAGVAEFAAGGPSDQARLRAAAAAYGAAVSDLGAAAESAKVSWAAAFMIQRLRWNADFALIDARRTANLAGGDLVAALQDRLAGTQFLQDHRFDGILVDNPRLAEYSAERRSAHDYADDYRSAGVAFIRPGGTITVAPGGEVRVDVIARALDFATHRVTWSADIGGAVRITPSAGTLLVAAGQPASATVTIAAGENVGRSRLSLRVGSPGGGWSSHGMDVVVVGPGDLSPYRDSVAVTSDGVPVAGGFDNQGCQYSLQALAASGVVPGSKIGAAGLVAVWPATGGTPDNIVARGQQVALPPSTRGSRLIFLAAAAPGDGRGAGWVTYRDGSTSFYQLDVPDWTLSHGRARPGGGAEIVAGSAYRVCGTGPTFGAAYVYAVGVPLERDREVASVVLPYAFGRSDIHVFGVVIG